MKAFYLTGALLLFFNVAHQAIAEEDDSGTGDGSIVGLAFRSLQILGADIDGSRNLCSGCHNTTDADTLSRWAQQALQVEDCIEQLQNTTPKNIIRSCLVTEETVDGRWLYKSHKLGILSAGPHLAQFKSLFAEAFGEEARLYHQDFVNQVGMPLRSPVKLDHEEVKTVYTWLRMGAPYLDELTNYQGPKTCESYLNPKLSKHFDDMQRFGWHARNQASGILMFGCTGSSPLTCFQQQNNDGRDFFPRSQDLALANSWHKAYPQATIRLLRPFKRSIRYWSRSSADGRFIASGGNPSFILDLASQLDREPYYRDITVQAYFDPSFFPDNSGFLFQGENTGVCRQSMLSQKELTHIDFTEPGCVAHDALNVPLYQGVGQSLDGEDYLAITGTFVSDMGYPAAPLSSKKYQLEMTPFTFNGQNYEQGEAWTHPSPYQIDWNISPSSRLLVSRQIGVVDGRLKDLGFHFYRRSDQNIQQSSEPRDQLERVASICTKGMKGKFSFDESLFVTYRYLQADDYAEWGFSHVDDPTFQSWLKQGMANLYLIDLRTGETKRITQMKPGQFALFPHFRSDGWIYFQALDQESRRRYFFASDAALR